VKLRTALGKELRISRKWVQYIVACVVFWGVQVNSDLFLGREWSMGGSLEKLGGGNGSEFFWEERGLGRLACV